MRPAPSYIGQLSLLMGQVLQGLAGDHSSKAAATIVEHATANSSLEAISSTIGFAGIAELVAAVAAKLQAITTSIATNFVVGFDRGFTTTAVVGSVEPAEVHTAMAQIAVAGTVAFAAAESPSYDQSIIRRLCRLFYYMAEYIVAVFLPF